jgi:23S rRNA pseudouridine2457 synthase
VQAEGAADESHLARLRAGLELNDGLTQPATTRLLEKAPDWLWPREPPVRYRKTVPESWLELTIKEGRNRQVRRMCAAVGLPCLRLVRISVGPHRLDGLAPGQWRSETG